MAENALVSEDIEAAARLVTLLDEKNLSPRVAFWLYEGDTERWRFMLAFREKRTSITSYYLDIAKVISQSGRRDLLDLAKVEIIDRSRPIVKALRDLVKIEGDSRIRLSHSRIDGVYLEDALIYRLSA